MHPVTRDAISSTNKEQKKEEEHWNSFLPIAPIAATIYVLLNKLPHHLPWCRKLRGTLDLNVQTDEDGKGIIIGKICMYEENYRRKNTPSDLMAFSECLWSLLDPDWFNASKVVNAIEGGQLFLKQYRDIDTLELLCQLESELLKFVVYYCSLKNFELRETKVDLDKTILDSEEIKRKLDRANDDIKKLQVELGAAKHEITRVHKALWTNHNSDSLDHVESPRSGLQSMLLQLQNANT
jgi:hypothetical protein